MLHGYGRRLGRIPDEPHTWWQGRALGRGRDTLALAEYSGYVIPVRAKLSQQPHELFLVRLSIPDPDLVLAVQQDFDSGGLSLSDQPTNFSHNSSSTVAGTGV